MKLNKINNPKIRFLDNCLLIKNKILVISDFHIGYEENLYGKLMPIRIQLKEILDKLNNIFGLLKKENIKIEEIIILGDLKHEFGEISESEWRETLELLDYLTKYSKKIILIKGNHDSVIGPIARKREVEIKDYYIKKEICFLHGNKMFKECKNSKILIMGHLHPAITFYDNYKKEKYKCFLKGIVNKKEVYILPSFVPLVFGYDLSNIKLTHKKKDFFIIPNKALKNLDIVVYNNIENKEYNFGKLKKLI